MKQYHQTLLFCNMNIILFSAENTRLSRLWWIW